MKSFVAALAMVVLSTTSTLAQPADDFKDTLSFSQWVEVDQGQDLVGRLVAVKDDGEIMAAGRARVVMTRFDRKSFRGSTDDLGRFTMDAIVPGFYALSAIGDDFCFTSAINVVSSEMEAADDLPAVLELPVTQLPIAAFIEPLQRYLPSDPLMPQLSMTDIELRKLNPSINRNPGFVVNQVDGGLSGRVFAPGAEAGRLRAPGLMNVMLFYGDSTIGPVQTRPNGTFYIADVPPNNYGIMVVGRSGLAISGLRVVEPNLIPVRKTVGDTVQVDSDAQTLVMLQGGGASSFQIQTAPAPIAAQSLESADPQSDTPPGAVPPGGPLGPPAPGLGAPGGGGGGLAGGGGAGGGGLGGGGGAGALGALGLLGALAGSDGDNGGGTPIATPPTPASPDGTADSN